MRDHSARILAYLKKGFLLPRNEKLSDIGALHYQEGTCLLVDWETLRSLS